MMKRRIVILASAAIALCTGAFAQKAATEDWVGIWHAHPDGLSTAALTLATDTGELGGTMVLDIISHEGGQTHVIAAEPHVLLNPHVDGNTLSFEVKTIHKGVLSSANFTVTRMAEGKATIQCKSCGADGPGIALTRDVYGEAKEVQP